MGKYIYLYRGPATSPADQTPEQTAEIMAAWEKWMGSLGSALVDGGAPFGERTAVVDDGSSTSASDLNGYTIVQADSLDAARKHTADHPFLSEGKGRFTLEVFELLPM
ncbi:MAG TPA: YciI family protein [Actinomycetes bacterium]|nr:YciI family protein [Actinomycetes bacterium]